MDKVIQKDDQEAECMGEAAMYCDKVQLISTPTQEDDLV